jgi:prepilin-type N-terminal cleavage/methylation domain-containing protein
MGAPRRLRDGVEEGFSLVEVMVAMMVLVVVMFSVTYVLVNSLADTAYARQRSEATNLANQTIEEIRALPWSTINQGMTATDLIGDANVVGNCFEGNPLDIASVVGTQTCTMSSWQDPACLSQTVTTALPDASALVSPAPISPHQGCYRVGTTDPLTYAVDVYITGTSGSSYLLGSSAPLTATVVVSWAHAFRNGLSDHVVTTTELSDCIKGNSVCS